MQEKNPETMTTFSEIILASQSPRRADILKKHGVDFSVYIPQVNEKNDGENLRDLPRINAVLKASAAADIFPDKVIIGADTVIFFENKLLGKPADEADAFNMLKKLSGKKHEVISGCAVICRSKNINYSFRCSSEVVFKNFSDETIRDYMRKVHVADKAGSYAIQEHGDMIIEHFSGSLENIIGLPGDELIKFLRDSALI